MSVRGKSFMRQSKFRHVFGQAHRRDQCYDNVRITKSSWDSTYCSVNPKFVAIITEAAGGGAFLVVPLSKVGRVDRDCPLVAGHKAAVLDIAWCPFNDNIIASGSEDCTVKIWQIPDDGLAKHLTEPVADLCGHQRRVGLVVWHPTANNILLSTGADNQMFIWNVGTEEPLVQFTNPDLVWCASFNHNGSKIVTTCKDKKIRVYDARSGDVLSEGKGHEGSKPSQCVFLKDGQIFTTGFSRMSDRQYALWNETNLNSSITLEDIDQSNGVIFPFYDADTNMVYLCGRGDSIIRYYEVTDEPPFVHFLALYQATSPQRGIGWMCKRGLNVNSCEIARFFKLHNSGLCEVIPFTVPRKSELYQDDLYPDTAGDVPALSADEWFDGKNADPVLISLKGGYVSTQKESLKVMRKSNILDKMPSKAQSQTQNNGSAAGDGLTASALPPVQLPPDFDSNKVLEELSRLCRTVKEQEKRISELEERVKALEQSEDVDPEVIG